MSQHDLVIRGGIIVSGQVVFEQGEATGALPGKLIRGEQRGFGG